MIKKNELKSAILRKFIVAPYMIWAAAFIVVPMFFVAYYAFTDRSGNFTLQWFVESQKYIGLFMQSIWFGLIATVICLILAFPVAFIISRAKPNVQKMLLMLVMIPMWMNLLIRTYAWMTLLQDQGVINNFFRSIGIGTVHMINTPGAVILGLVYNFFPYMVLPIYTVLIKLDNTLIEASQDLGSTSMQVFTKVVVPLSLPGVISGITMVFVPSVSSFYIANKLGGMSLIGDRIEELIRSNINLGAALSLVLMVLILISISVMNNFTDEEGGILV